MCTKKCCSWPRKDQGCHRSRLPRLQGCHRLSRLSRGISRTPAAATLERSVTLVNYFHQLTYVTKNSILDVARVLDPRLKSVLTIMLVIKKIMVLFTLTYPFVLCGVVSSVPSSLVYSYVPLFQKPSHKFKDDLIAYLNRTTSFNDFWNNSLFYSKSL